MLVPRKASGLCRVSKDKLDRSERFVDAPGREIEEVDRLVMEVMLARGYPMARFDKRAGNLSVNHHRKRFPLSGGAFHC